MTYEEIDKIKRKYGELLQKERLEHKISKNRMNREAHISIMQTGQIENAETNYTIESLIRFADAVNYDVKLIKRK